MARKKKPLPLLKEILITDAGSRGKSIAKVDDRVVFVSGAVPGDVCDLQVFKKKRNFYEARATYFHHYSNKRSDAFCAHFGTCGGCKWQELGYEHQLFYKNKEVQDNFKHLGKFDFPEPLPILAAPKTTFYRNKMEFTFSNKRWLDKNEMIDGADGELNALGFHVPGRFDKIVDVETCHLQSDLSNQIKNFIRDFCLTHAYEFFDLKKQVGLMRNLIIRNTLKGDVMVIVVFYQNNKMEIQNLMEAIQEKFPEISSLMYVINPKKNDTIGDLPVQLFSGKDYITEEMEGIQFKIGPKSFYQTNSEQAYNLYKIVRDFADLKGKELVYDLYTGTGTIANFIAQNCKKVIGVEYVEEAIEDAKINSQQNKIKNTAFFAGDMKDVLSDEFLAKNGKADVIITDPPRAGMHPDVVQTILRASPDKIVYVSCNPATQARDLNDLCKQYQIVKSQAVDMFPQTHHVENVVLLHKKN